MDGEVLLQANTVVTEIEMIMSHIESEYAHLLPEKNVHHGDSGDLLYTSEEVEEFNNTYGPILQDKDQST